MKNPAETLMEELEEERKALRVNILLTAITLIGLLAGVYFQVTEGPLLFEGIAFLVAFLAGGFALDPPRRQMVNEVIIIDCIYQNSILKE